MPRILVNIRFLSHRVTGVERYAGEVTRLLKGRLHPVGPVGWRRAWGVWGHLWEQLVLPARVGRHDLLWSPANSGPLVLSNQVISIQDLGPIDRPEWFEPRFRIWYRYLLPRLARRARRVITSSAFSKRRIVQVAKVPAAQVVVIPPGVDASRFHPLGTASQQRVRARHGLPDRYVLFMGAQDGRKNLPALLEAWGRLRTRDPEVELVVAGGSVHTLRPPVLPEVPGGVRFFGYVPETELPGLYAAATLLAIPSTYEGFGLPALEAMACGVPVVAAAATALPETVGTTGMLVDPGQVASLVEALERLLGDEGLRTSLAAQGLERSRSFTWEKTAETVWETLVQAAAIPAAALD